MSKTCVTLPLLTTPPTLWWPRVDQLWQGPNGWLSYMASMVVNVFFPLYLNCDPTWIFSFFPSSSPLVPLALVEIFSSHPLTQAVLILARQCSCMVLVPTCITICSSAISSPWLSLVHPIFVIYKLCNVHQVSTLNATVVLPTPLSSLQGNPF